MEFLLFTIIFMICLFTALILFSISYESWFIDVLIAVMFLGCMCSVICICSLVGRY